MHTLSSVLGVLVASFALVSAADHGLSSPHGHRARHLLARNEAAQATDASLGRRSTSGEFTYYVTGMGACGHRNEPSDYIVAMNSAQFGGGSRCGEMITITINGKSAQAQIVDECPSCAPGGVDFSQGLFEHFGPTSLGVLHGSWSFSSEPTTTSTTHTPTSTSTSTTPTSTWTPTTTSTSTSTHVEPSTTSTPTPTTTSTKETPTTTSSTSTTPLTTSTSITSNAAPSITQDQAAPATETAAFTPATGGDLENLNLLIVQLSNVVAQGAVAR